MKASGRPSGPIKLSDKVQFLSGVGPFRAQQLGKLGVITVGDLLEYFPFRHERREWSTVEHLELGTIATIVGQVTAVRRHHGRVDAAFTDNTGRCSLVWFNADWAAERLRRGAIIKATGKVREFMRLPQLVNPTFVILGEDASPVDEATPMQMQGVYPTTAGLSMSQIRKLIDKFLDGLLPQVEEWYTPAYRAARKLPERRWAIGMMHRPTREEDVAAARRRLAYDELLLLQLATTLARRRGREGLTAQALPTSEDIDGRIRRRFPFSLTGAQDRAVREISADLAKPQPMNRLLQGDVGCGKTVVALYAALSAVANKSQVAIMAPTELLAEQHHQSVTRYLDGSRVRIGLLVGGLPASERADLLRRIEAGEIDIVVGTHALIQADVRFKRLALVVVDEQHRFGVRQRATIRGKGPAPHYLVMTATPIPRTLAMTVFGDLDVTTIDELPPGRSGIKTRVIPPRDQAQAWAFVQQRLAAGEQAFVVYPLIEESEKVDLRAATKEFETLKTKVFMHWQTALLHGRMDRDERERIMADFAAGRTQALVATTVIEVGIDVPGATCMVIEHAERFGLSQLHQLRGRIGRGDKPGHCFLLPSTAAAAQHNERLNVLARTLDGFKIAEEDLRLRGPGEMLGTRQHGLPELRVADLVNDAKILRAAQKDAADIVRRDPRLQSAEHAVLRAAVLAKYRDKLDLMDVA